MATYTPNLNLTLPAGNEYVSRVILNDNWEKVDAAMVPIVDDQLTIEPSDWSSVSPYTFTWTDARILATSRVNVRYLASSADVSAIFLSYEVPIGGGSIVFETADMPTDDIILAVTIA